MVGEKLGNKYLDFCLKKEKVMAQWELIEEMVTLIHDNKVDYREVLNYEVKKVGNEIEKLRPLEEKYKNKKRKWLWL